VIMKRPCFTLIELLVVIAVIALLVAILIPALQSSKKQARAVVCSSNIKQLAVGLFMYEAENQSFPYGFRNIFNPPPGGYAGNLLFDRPGWWWFHYIPDYTGRSRNNKTILWCPSRKIKAPELNHVLHGNYGVNRSICKSSDDIQHAEEEFIGTPLRGSDIPRPGRTLLIVDSGYSIVSWWHVTDVPPVPPGSSMEDAAYVPGLEINKDRDLRPGFEADAIDGRHPNRTVNIGFADGHSERIKADDLFVEKSADAYTNRSPLWSPK